MKIAHTNEFGFLKFEKMQLNLNKKVLIDNFKVLINYSNSLILFLGKITIASMALKAL